MSTEPAKVGLHFKMAEVMAEIGAIPKNGYNDFHKYHYVLESDIVEAVRSKLSARKVAVYTASKIIETREWQTPKGKPTLVTHVQVEITFADGESGETFTITSAGTGDDASDKGTYKAITGAVKYGLMKTFLISTGDDPELESPRSDRAEPNGFALTSSQAITEAKNELVRIIGAENARTAYNAALLHAGVHAGEVPTPEQTQMIIASLKAAGGVPV